VTKTLAAGLQNIRAVRSGVLALWIDQICIDEEDLDEKGHQVQLMALIYQKARSNLVWLGESPYQSNRALIW
jgi:hypothetical protein